nr:type II secretion system F family protein [Ramlibacter montanisoli]
MRFQLKALRKGEGIVEAVLEAPGEAEAMLMARAQGLRVLSISSQQAWFAAPRRRDQAFPLPLFAQELVTLLRAGLPLIEAIESLAEKEQHGQHRKVLDRVARALHEGQSFSQALAQVPSAFPELFIALVRSSERTGNCRRR